MCRQPQQIKPTARQKRFRYFVDELQPHLVGILLLTASLAFWSPYTSTIDHFDILKRSLLAYIPLLSITMYSLRWRDRKSLVMPSIILLIMAWIIMRQWAHSPWWREWDVTVGWLFPFLFLFTGMTMLARPWRILNAYLLISCCIQVMLMLAQYHGYDPLFQDWLRPETRSAKMIGTIGYHNQAAAYLALLLGVAWFSLPKYHYRLMALLACLLTIALTGSRGAFLGVLAALTVSLSLPMAKSETQLSSRKNTPPRLAAIVVVFVVLVSTAPILRDRFGSIARLDVQDAGITSRLIMQRVAIRLWQSKPFSGRGGGAFAYHYIDQLGEILPQNKEHAILRSVVYARETHNTYLQFLAEFGITGLLLLAILFGILLRAYWRGREHTPEMAGLGIFTLTYISVHAIGSFPWQMSMAGPLAGLLLGGAYATCQQKDVSNSPHRTGNLSQFIACLISIAFVFLAFITMMHYHTHARIVRQLPQLEKAEQVREFTASLPKWGHRYAGLAGAILAEQGSRQEARLLLETASKGYMDVSLLNNLGNVYSSLGQWAAAREVYQRWVNSGLQHRDALHNLSTAYEHINDFQSAFLTLRERRRLWPQTSWNEDIRYAALALQNQIPKYAIDALKPHAAENLPIEKQSQTRNILGAAWLMNGNPIKAKTLFQKVLAQDPDNSIARGNLELLVP